MRNSWVMGLMMMGWMGPASAAPPSPVFLGDFQPGVAPLEFGIAPLGTLADGSTLWRVRDALWRTDARGSRPVRDFEGGWFLDSRAVRSGDALVFMATAPGRTHGFARSDGTSLGTAFIGGSVAVLRQAAPLRWRDRAWATDARYSPYDDPPALVVSDGSAAGTRRVMAWPGGVVSHPALGADRLWLLVEDPRSGEAALWTSDGTTEGTREIYAWPVRQGAQELRELADLGDRVLFTFATRQHGRELWVSDGTSGGTRLADDLRPGPRSGLGAASTMATIDGRAFFVLAGETGYVLASHDGTPGSVRVHLPLPRFAGNGRDRLLRVGRTVFVQTADGPVTALHVPSGRSAELSALVVNDSILTTETAWWAMRPEGDLVWPVRVDAETLAIVATTSAAVPRGRWGPSDGEGALWLRRVATGWRVDAFDALGRPRGSRGILPGVRPAGSTPAFRVAHEGRVALTVDVEGWRTVVELRERGVERRVVRVLSPQYYGNATGPMAAGEDTLWWSSFDRANGARVWRWPLGVPEPSLVRAFSSPAFAIQPRNEGAFIVLTTPENEETLWATDGTGAGSRRVAGPGVLQGALVEGDDRVEVVARSANGLALWRVADGSTVGQSLAELPVPLGAQLLPPLDSRSLGLMPLVNGARPELQLSRIQQDGTITPLLEPNAGPFTPPAVRVGAMLYLVLGGRLYRTDGLTAQAVEGAPTLAVGRADLVALGDRLVFAGIDDAHGRESNEPARPVAGSRSGGGGLGHAAEEPVLTIRPATEAYATIAQRVEREAQGAAVWIAGLRRPATRLSLIR